MNPNPAVDHRHREHAARRGLRHWGLALLLLLSRICSGAAEPGDEVVVAYNSRIPESLTLARYYAQVRHIPTNQVFGLECGTGDEVSRTEFEVGIQRPLARWLEQKNLWQIRAEILSATNGQPARIVRSVKDSFVRYLVLCYGIPFRIKEDPNLKESNVETLRPELRRNGAAVDSELATLPMIEQHPPLTGPLRNWVYTSTNRAFLHPTNGLLMVSRLDGPDANIARGLVDKALQAEADGLWGRAYFDLRSITNTDYKLGDEWIRGASELCRHWGFETIVDEQPETFPAEFPMSQIAFYCGWYDPAASGPFARPTVEFMPGAFAYHLHSYSAARLRSPTENWVGPLLARGATISMGSVEEPFLSGTPDIAVFTARLLYQGFSFGEAAYAAQSVLSWQTTVVGDPLYRPFARTPAQLHTRLEQTRNPLLDWSLLGLANLNLAKGTPIDAAVDFLEHSEATRRSAVLTEKLGDLYQAQGKPSSAAAEVERALRLNPTPQQRVRLQLSLAGRLTALHREAEAYRVLRQLLESSPDYPARAALLRRLQTLAGQAKDTVEMNRCEAELRALSPGAAAGQPPPR